MQKIKIYGIAASNYYSALKTALIEKDFQFEEVTQLPSQDQAILIQSPMGKIPFIEVNGRFLSETNVIYDFLEEIKPTPSLYPDDAFEKAKIKEIIRTVELYLDSPARRHLGAAVFGEDINQAALEEAKPAIEKGIDAFNRLAKFGPFVAGENFTIADIASYFHIGFTNFHTKTIYDWDITETHPDIKNYLELLGQRNSINSVQISLEKALMEIINS
jgi:glutathione S-transferase